MPLLIIFCNLFLLSAFVVTSLGFSSFKVAAAGSCDNYTPDANGTTVTCSATGSTSVGVISTSSNTGVGNGATVNILDPSTSLVINGSTIGLGSGAIVTNNGILNASSFFYGYGISSGANAGSQAGGSTITNNGTILTGGTNAAGIYISATNAGSTANTVVNTGTITHQWYWR